MKTVYVVATILVLGATSAAAVEPVLPRGSYSGPASWRGPDGSSGTYTAEKTFSGNTLRGSYSWPDPARRKERYSVAFVLSPSEPVFDVLDGQGRVVGRGRCDGHACAYRASFGDVSVDESFRWSTGKMTVRGSKSGPGFAVIWKETLAAR
jgi:hypothetical protein